jgi:pimeloyl-ACP methyl ester carboxylesterase
MTHTHNSAPTQFIEVAGTRLAYRRFGTPGHTPVVFLQHFMGNLDDFDPAISDGLGTDREIVLFDNTGVGASSGEVPSTIEEMARDAASFIDALGLDEVDIVAHSMGGLVGQQLATDRPDLVRRLVLVGTGPRGGEEIGNRPAWVNELFAQKPPRYEDMWLPILFAPSETSQAAGRDFIERILQRPDRDAPVSQQSVLAQRDAIGAYGARKDPAYRHLKNIKQPVLVVNGGDDIIITTINSYILQQFLPDAQLIIYPDANHGSHFQYPERFVTHTREFLDNKQ